MSVPRAVLVLSVLLVSLPSSTFASNPIVSPITKDPSTSLYTIPIKNGAPMVLDLAGNLVWFTCKDFRMIHCKSSICKVANRYRQPNCGPASPAAIDDPRCFCKAHAYNPVSGHCDDGPLAALPLSANATDGQHPLFPVSFSTYAPCAQEEALQSLPSGAAGVAGLSRMPLSLPSMVASRLKVAKQFTLCLPSGGQTGAAIFGGGPFQLMGSPSNLAAELRQNALPLVKNPKNGAYYFRLHGIAVNQELVPLDPRDLDLDMSKGLTLGRGGVAFSTVTPYTTLRYDIFGNLASAFDKATSGIPRREAPLPFALCYEASALSSTQLGPAVPNIDLMLDNGRNWTITGSNSLVQVDEHTMCFAFRGVSIEARLRPNSMAIPESPTVILGAYQMENNLVQFDLDKSTFSFSGPLAGRRTQCGNFNFNMGS